MIWLLLVIMMLTGCRSVQYVPMDRVQTDTVYIYRHRSDTLIVRDSIFVEKGDTIKEYRYKYIYAYRDRVDTMYVNKTDSVRIPYPAEKRLTRWQQLKQDIGGLMFTLALVLVLLMIGKRMFRQC